MIGCCGFAVLVAQKMLCEDAQAVGEARQWTRAGCLCLRQAHMNNTIHAVERSKAVEVVAEATPDHLARLTSTMTFRERTD